ncbi:acyl-CoA N-acyltransferase [Massariosphaeria phaeospora]|uniref:Acyl-CoA N-acyltransferase n=1 Tax=Massariosphaeria phaeospora TaxID=100035 RepID=A0A7C8ILI4_9PLEO|nr:acyl-CoA N-acyltransferase [Massariosphaeria phaeospora]
MPFTISECTDADMPRAFELLSLAFGHEHPYIESVFPAHATAEGRRVGGERFLEFRKADPLATKIKAVDVETGNMIGHARWIVCDGGLAPEFELDGSLDLMTVDPEHQRKGVGRKLLAWGLAVADKLGVGAVVEATEYGLGLYKAAGYKVKHDYEVLLPEKWAGRETQRYWWMARPKLTTEEAEGTEQRVEVC